MGEKGVKGEKGSAGDEGGTGLAGAEGDLGFTGPKGKSALEAGKVFSVLGTITYLQSMLIASTNNQHRRILFNMTHYVLSDVDECLSATLNECDPETTTCVNWVGAYRCDCKAGYRRTTRSQLYCIGKKHR